MIAITTKTGQVYTMGRGTQGQLGHGEKQNTTIPTLVTMLPKQVIQVSCGLNHTFALTHDGLLYGWGKNESGQLGVDTRQAHMLHPVQVLDEH